MKIIQSSLSHSWGGLEMQTLKIARALQERAYDVEVLCPSGSTLERESLGQNVNVISVPAGNLHTIKNIRNLANLFKNKEYRIIHTHLSHDLLTLVPALKLVKNPAKLFLTKRMGSSVKKKDILHRFLYNRVDKIFAISNYIVESVLKTCPVPEEKVTLMPNALLLKDYEPARYDKSKIRKKLGIPENRLVVGMVGRFTPMKGHREFFEAAKILKEKSKQKPVYLVVGGASHGEKAYENEIRELADGFGLSDDIIFTGFQKDIPKMMAVMDILAFPSHKESFGNILLEAMAMRLPVVASNSGGVPDIVLPGETGLLAPPKDPESLAMSLAELLIHTELRVQMGEAARKRVELHYDFEKYIDRLEMEYRN